MFDGDTTTQATVDRELAGARRQRAVRGRRSKQSSSPVALTNTNGSINADVSAAWVNALVQYEAIDRARAPHEDPGHRRRTGSRRRPRPRSSSARAEVFAKFPKWFRDRELAPRGPQGRVRAAGTRRVPTDADAQAYYDQNLAQICPSGKVISHILVATQAEADAIEQQLADGADFATIAKAKSTDTQSGAQGGLLGCLAAGQTVPEFEAAANALAVGQISAPVQTQYGFHVIKARGTDVRALRAAGARRSSSSRAPTR